MSSDSLPLEMLSETEQSCQLLRRFNCRNVSLKVGSHPGDPAPSDPQRQDAENDRHQLRAALRCVVHASDYQILGICADTLDQGLQALKSYAAALNYPNVPDLATLEGSVYIKFNPNTQLCYASPYSGEHRGVLVSCQSADESNLNEMFGHLPLDLFVDG